MAQISTREEIIRKGAGIIHAQGYNATGIQQVLDAAGVPKGSFYFYFKSKEDFGLAVIDYFREYIEAMTDKYLKDDDALPLKRLSSFFDAYGDIFTKMDFCCGCPIGNLMQEMSDLNENFRSKISEVYCGMQTRMENLLKDAMNKGEIPAEADPAQIAQFIVNAWEGAIMHMKVAKNVEPLLVFKKMVFERVLK